jgi:hypothetical protein
VVDVAAALAGLLITVIVVAVAVRLLRQPIYRYRGDPRPQGRRPFRETTLAWLMGPRN